MRLNDEFIPEFDAPPKIEVAEQHDRLPELPEAKPPEQPPKDTTPTLKPLVIEICAGTAMLSRCFQEVGFDVMAVDHSHNRFHPLAHICTLDLTLKSSWEFLYYVVRNFPVCFVHAAPPCGTM